MERKILIPIILIAVVLFGLGIVITLSPETLPKAQTIQISPTSVPDGDDSKIALGTFKGTLPCADCEGIETILTLYQNPETLGATTYALKQRYLGTEVEPTVETGNWDYLRGTPTDPDATVYALNPDKPKEEQIYYLKDGDAAVTLLDSSMNMIQSDLNFTLKKE